MSLITSMYAGVSGLEANSNELSVVGDNISNANTVGFKSSRAAFQDALAQSLMGGSAQLGLGTSLQAIQRLVTQGALANTGQATDLALQGPGFFMVKGAYNGTVGNFYTRAGQFTVDDSGYLVNLQGLKVQGYTADATGAIVGAVGDLKVGASASAPNPTANVTLKGNLQADAAIITAAWNPAKPGDTSNFSTSTTVYDALGKAHQVDVYFRRTGAGAWEWHALTDGAGITGGTAGTASEIATGTMTFDTTGKLSASTQTGTFNPIGTTNPQPLTFNFGKSTASGGTGLDGFTQFASTSAVTFLNQDGYASGQLARISVDGTGTIIGAFTNGQSRAIGQVAVAGFTAADRLSRLGGNLYAETNSSGQPTVGAPGDGGRGSIVAGALEQSNVDLGSEFVRMIAAQRGYEANSKIVTTADQLLGELINLKR